MKDITQKRPDKFLVVSSAIAIATVIIGAVIIYRPFSNNSAALREEILRERERNLLIGKIRGLGKHLKVYREALPEEGRGVSWLLSTVSEMASSEKIEVSSIKPGAPEERYRYSRLYVTMDTISSYEQLGKFISKVESYEKFLQIENINIKRLDSDEAFNKDATKLRPFDIRAHIVISTIILKE